MGERIKLLIAYDGSSGSDAVINDLPLAGLPEQAEAVVMCVTEMWLPPPPSFGFVETDFAHALEEASEEALQIAKEPLERIHTLFPRWEIQAEGHYGSAAHEILEKANEWNPDLILVGSHGRSTAGRLIFGSVSQRVVAEAHCSVRVARSRSEESGTVIRNLVGLDGSHGSEEAVDTILSRNWPKGSEIRLVTAAGPFDLIGVPLPEKKAFALNLQKSARKKIEEAGLVALSVIQEKEPKQILLEEAEKWGATCIFVGTRGLNRLNRLLLGSVSTAITARAHCSVEVIRGKHHE